MHPLRFSNSGIRAKAVRRRGSQPWPAPMQGRTPTGQPVKVDWLWLEPARRGDSRWQDGARKGLSPTASPTARRGGGAGRRGGCRRARAVVACAGATAA
ncbi:hypothetical protein B296_00046491 [Ensete ventricosum]|uniref:Uncharacterized protein n=1 Tax=Ensete ventricosum TaxID=4639 RepID=A0A426WXJ3_ENSVE|nr:hypothetical protein B296_00046491 [Ensete ventricosum]